jgi:hypothetical protein
MVFTWTHATIAVEISHGTQSASSRLLRRNQGNDWAMEWWQWVLVGLGAWIVASVIVLVILARVAPRLTRGRDIVPEPERDDHEKPAA